MVKKALLTVLLGLVVSASLLANEFTATVDETQVPISERIALTLTLSGANPVEAPDITALKALFIIHSQQLASHMTMVNGRVSTNISWKLSLTAQKEGPVTIPAIPVETNQGWLWTEPLMVTVTKALSTQAVGEQRELIFTATTSQKSPYKNEPFIFTALLTSKMPLYQIQIPKFQVENAIVEQAQEPKLEERFVDGTRRNVVEFSYLITPLKPGKLTIPAASVQGAVPQKNKKLARSFMDDPNDPFVIFQGMNALQAFTLVTDPIELDVQPAVTGISPWLPAQDLVLEEQWPNDQQLRVGEPISRGIVLKATGVKASQLPSLEAFQSANGAFKVYADQPEQAERVANHRIYSTRKESYTLIPQQADAVLLPEISVDWWDTSAQKKRTATIPARTVHVLPAVETPRAVVEPAPVVAAPVIIQANVPWWLYGIIGSLAAFLLIALLWVISLKRKIHREPKPKERLRDLNPT